MVSFNDESNSIPFSKQKGSPRGCTKWKAFIGRRDWKKEVSGRVDYFRQSHLPLEEGRGLAGSRSARADQVIPD